MWSLKDRQGFVSGLMRSSGQQEASGQRNKGGKQDMLA